MTWRSSIGQVSAVLGPAAGGFLIGLLHGATGIYLLNAAAALIFILLLPRLRVRPRLARDQGRSLRSLVEGVRFSGAARSCWPPSPSTCSPCCSAAPPRCCPCSPGTSCTLAPLAWAGCRQPPRSAPSAWPSCWPTAPPSPRRAHPAARGRRVRPGHRRLRPVPLVLALAADALLARRTRQYQRGHSQHPGAVRTPDEMRGRVGAVTRCSSAPRISWAASSPASPAHCSVRSPPSWPAASAQCSSWCSSPGPGPRCAACVPSASLLHPRKRRNRAT